MFISVAHAQEAAAAASQPNSWESFLPMIAMFFVLYFFILRPQMKKGKEHQNLLSTLQRGDEVVTSSGVLGKIDGLTNEFVTLEIANGVKVKIQRHHISSKFKESGK